MKISLLVVCVLVAVSLACSLQVATPVPLAATSTAVPTATRFYTATTTATRQWEAKVVLPTVNVRDEPDGSVIGAVTSGSVVEIVSCTDDWCKIKEPAGYVWRGCLSDNPAGLACRSK